MLTAFACGDSTDNTTNSGTNPGAGGSSAGTAGSSGSSGEGGTGTSGSAGTTGGTGGSAGTSSKNWGNCYGSGQCTLVAITCPSSDEISAVGSAFVDDYIKASCPDGGEPGCTCEVLKNTSADFRYYAHCSDGVVCTMSDQPDTPPEGAVCPTEPPSPETDCPAPARCEYSDDQRIDCRHALDCSGLLGTWTEYSPNCPSVSTCEQGIATGTSCTDPNALCSQATENSWCLCSEIDFQVYEWTCYTVQPKPNCPTSPPALGQPCDTLDLCCDYGASENLSIIATVRVCAGNPSVWVEEALSVCP